MKFLLNVIIIIGVVVLIFNATITYSDLTDDLGVQNTPNQNVIIVKQQIKNLEQDIKELKIMIEEIRNEEIKFQDAFDHWENQLDIAFNNEKAKNTIYDNLVRIPAQNQEDIDAQKVAYDIWQAHIQTRIKTQIEFNKADSNLIDWDFRFLNAKNKLVSWEHLLPELEEQLVELKKIANRIIRFSGDQKRSPLNDLGIVLSQTCLVMLKNNISTNCPTYEGLSLIYSDTSIHNVSGEFEVKDGIWQRGKPNMINHYRYYDFSVEPIFWIDPPGDIRDEIRLIIVESRLGTYQIAGQTITNSSVMVGEGRYTNPACTESTISAKLWLTLLGDTIWYLNHDCNPEFTNFNEIKIISWEKTIHDITTSYKYILDKWMKESIERCGQRICFYE